jgi:hypothetical protein
MKSCKPYKAPDDCNPPTPRGATGARGEPGATGLPGTSRPGTAGPKGDTGLPGKDSLTWRLAWGAGTSYAVDDGVLHDGRAWIALRMGINEEPSDASHFWALLADHGAPGPPGPQGTGSIISGHVPDWTPGNIPPNPKPGSAWILESAAGAPVRIVDGSPAQPGDGMIWDGGGAWFNAGQLRGPVGPSGAAAAQGNPALLRGELPDWQVANRPTVPPPQPGDMWSLAARTAAPDRKSDGTPAQAGDAMVFNGVWYNAGPVIGPPGQDEGIIGEITLWPTVTPPGSHLLCDGNTFDPLAYPVLNVILGGNVTPNLVGQFIRGGIPAESGNTFPGTTAAPTIPFNGSAAAGGAHDITGSAAAGGAHNITGSSSSAGAHTPSGKTAKANRHRHGMWDAMSRDSLNGNSEGHYDGGFDGNHANFYAHGNTNWDPEHDHGLVMNAVAAHSHNMALDPVPDHSHNVAIDPVPDHTHTGLTITGGDATTAPAHIIMAYIIRAK